MPTIIGVIVMPLKRFSHHIMCVHVTITGVIVMPFKRFSHHIMCVHVTITGVIVMPLKSFTQHMMCVHVNNYWCNSYATQAFHTSHDVCACQQLLV